MSFRPSMGPWEKLNFVRRIPSEQVLTHAEAKLYTGVFASRGYDQKNAYNYYSREAINRRSGYLRGLGADQSLWDTVRDWFGVNAADDVPEEGYVDCSRLPPTPEGIEMCKELIEAARGRVTITDTETTRTDTREGPSTGIAWATVFKWTAIAAAVGAGAYAVSEVFGSARRRR